MSRSGPTSTRAEQIEALLTRPASSTQGSRRRRHVQRRAMIATLMFAGLRIGELCALRWRDVDLAAGWLYVGEAKTDAGRRRVKLRGALRDGLSPRSEHRRPTSSRTPTCSRHEGRGGRENIRNRCWRRGQAGDLGARSSADSAAARGPDSALAAANVRKRALRARRGSRRGHGRDGPYRPGLALRDLPSGDASRRGRKGRLRALVEGGQSANIGQQSDSVAPQRRARESRLNAENPALAGLSSAPGRIRTCDLSLRRRTLYPLSYGRSDGGDARARLAAQRPWGQAGIAAAILRCSAC